nr:hypothetical protein [uncultured Pseudodesulfovibrio sp.]
MIKEMIKNVVLKRKIDFQVWRIKATIAKAEDRPEYMPILMQLKEYGQCSAKDVAAHLFCEEIARESVAERMLDTAVSLKLADRNRRMYSLTESGEKAIQSKQIFVPEEGTWEVWISQDPLLPFNILRLKSFEEPKSYQENHQRRVIEKLPQIVFDDLKAKEGNPCLGGELIRIDSCERKAEKVNDHVSIPAEWNLFQQSIKLKPKKGSLEMQAPQIDSASAWMDLLRSANIEESWNSESETLMRKFQDVDQTSRFSMRETVRINKPTISRVGQFDKIDLPDVPISPATNSDAQEWAAWQLENSIDRVMTSARYEELCSKTKATFGNFQIELPERDSLAKELWNKQIDDRSWNLMAAADWNL